MRYEIYWELAADGGARILRVYGTTPEAVLPKQIEGIPVTEIGAYCFAAQARLPENYNRTQIEMPDTAAESVGAGMRSETGAGMQPETGAGMQPEIAAGMRSEIGAGMQPEKTGMQAIVDGKKKVSGMQPESTGAGTPPTVSGMRELAGEYPTHIVIPDTVGKLGNFAFYNAVSLQMLAIGRRLTEIGSDAFMNCRNLHFLLLHCGRGEGSGLRQILAQISHDLEVSFAGEGGVWAKLLFPEYYESYDEIAPAHLFGRNIEGEGFRARQSFRDGVMDFAQYDVIFPKACAEEREETLCGLALNRLRYPVELGEAPRRLYEEYLTAHAVTLCALLTGERDTELAEFLCREHIFARADLERCIRYAAGDEWAEGSAYFLRLLNQYFPEKDVASRYTFEDF